MRNITRSRVVLIVVAVSLVAAAVAAGALVVANQSSKTAPGTVAGHGAPARKRVVPRRPVRVARCPLTGEPVWSVPARPALMVKIGNEPGPARPQSGLNEADIVFDTPAEGFIMRYIAVYQCQNAALIGPLRSVRWVDYNIAPELGQPILAFAGGINPNLQAVAGLPWISGANLIAAQAGAGFRTSNRRPPDNLYTTTGALYGLFGNKTQPPKPIFTFTKALPAGAPPVASAELYFSPGTDVVWQWQPSTHTRLHTYSGLADIDTLTNQPVTATNVVIQVVPYTIGPYVESRGGTGDVQSETTGTGAGFVLRDGHVVPVVWHRANPTDPMTFTTASGRPIGLAPGHTWVEIMTQTQAAGGIHLTP